LLCGANRFEPMGLIISQLPGAMVPIPPRAIGPNKQPPAEGYGDQSAGNPETRDAIHSGALLITPPLVGRRAGKLKRPGAADPVRLYNKRPK
jgi:hypothetical protein